MSWTPGPVIFVGMGLGLVILFPLVFLILDEYAAYHSPLYSATAEWTPRQQALRDREEAKRRELEEERERLQFLQSLTPEKMIESGQEIVSGKGLCFNCHSIGDEGGGTQGPNLKGIGERAANRVSGKGALEYLAESLYQPKAFVVDGFAPTMIPVNEPPISLTELETLMVIAFLQSLGGDGDRDFGN